MQHLMNGRQRRRAAEIANELLERIAKQHDIDLRSIREGKFAHLVAARREYYIAGREMEIPLKVLAAAVHMHHTTVTYHTNERYRTTKNARRPPRPPTREGQYGRPQTAQGHRRANGMAVEGCGTAR